MTATKKKQSKPSGGGTLMNMRSGFKKAVGQGKTPAKKKWTFLQVFYIVAGVTVLFAIVYAFTAR